MACIPPSRESLEALRKLRNVAAERGEECLSALLAGIDLYVSLGQEIELLQMMRDYSASLRESVEGTPSPEDLKRLYDDNDEDTGKS
ncbi:MAG TPA: hypothetical protein VKU01_20555 [Bryobacteraceae bacterium]|nr:hypothetical protein [Bryobacteraceae bacterium]